MKGGRKELWKVFLDLEAGEDRTTPSNYPTVICASCEKIWGKRECGLATWYPGKCGICSEVTDVTQPRDFGHLRDGWDKRR